MLQIAAVAIDNHSLKCSSSDNHPNVSQIAPRIDLLIRLGAIFLLKSSLATQLCTFVKVTFFTLHSFLDETAGRTLSLAAAHFRGNVSEKCQIEPVSAQPLQP